MQSDVPHITPRPSGVSHKFLRHMVKMLLGNFQNDVLYELDAVLSRQYVLFSTLLSKSPHSGFSLSVTHTSDCSRLQTNKCRCLITCVTQIINVRMEYI